MKKLKKDKNKQSLKIKKLEKMIAQAKTVIQEAQSSLSKITGEKIKTKAVHGQEIIHGEFNGENMIGPNHEVYNIPANYASKSKLVQGDKLKLTILPDGSFLYKQIGPIERKRVKGILEQSTDGHYLVNIKDTKYKVLLASVTYFKAELNDEIIILIPKHSSSAWAAIENVVKKDNYESIEFNDF
ncbi:hypothetical protein CL633_00115 [bacterium]|nr:hypothetical protein [bacterium]|tara:strand:+ start:352 stop:906 length:555 start_codon:yes stop_codon:yes gene_type:complete